MRNDQEAFSLVLDVIQQRRFTDNVSKHPRLGGQQEHGVAEIGRDC